MEIQWYCELLTKVIMCSPGIMSHNSNFISIVHFNHNIFYVQISDPTTIYNNRRTVQPPSTQKSDASLANSFYRLLQPINNLIEKWYIKAIRWR
jgi:hypothetical protein